MDINKQTLKVLEWDTILKELSRHATSEIGKLRCLDTPVYSEIEKIKYEQSLTSEARFLLDNAFYPPLGGIRNISDSIGLAKIGHVLKAQELIDIANTIGASRKIKSFTSRYKEEIPLLDYIGEGLFENKKLEEEILEIFDEAGNVLDNASADLRKLRLSYRDQTANLKHKLNSLIHSSSFSKYLQEPVYTMRDDRYVLPVKIEFKSFVDGIIHDSSSSGATLFIEPKVIVDLNNSLKETELSIEHEIRKIFTELTDKIRNHTHEIEVSVDILAEIDFIFAKAKYSIALKAIEPTINTEKFIYLKNVKHPILMQRIDNVVPNSIEIGNNWNILIITGSNTGGKTVMLKTLGLCTLMAKAGLHIPAYEANIYPFKNIFSDIGDEQSIIQNLSTFSGHMTNIISIINNVNDNSLVLLDEIGAGTDPSEGSALAQSILEKLYEKGSRAVVTTHYGELKALAYTQKGFYNASVEFDIDSLSPTYKLIMGLPGKSNAITIAKNLGLNIETVENAQNIYIHQKDQTGEVLEGLQNTQQELSKNAQEVKSTKEELGKLEKEYTEKLEGFRTEKTKTINVYKKKFDTELAKAKLEIKEILEEARRTKSEKVARRSINKLGEIESNLREISQKEIEENQPEYESINWKEIKPGNMVLVKDIDQEAELIDLPDKNNNVQVQIGLFKTNVKANRLFKPKSKRSTKKAQALNNISKVFSFPRSNISNTLDLRGTTADEALDKLDNYLDNASLTSLNTVSIIHGHGLGILKKAVREYLNTSPYVSKFRPGSKGEGGDGVTVVDLR